MPEQVHAFDELATREGFNRSLKHFKFISRVIGEFESKAEHRGHPERLPRGQDPSSRGRSCPRSTRSSWTSITTAADRTTSSENFDAFDGLAATVAGWRAVDMVVTYFHPELGVVVVNPKNRAHWEGGPDPEEERAGHRVCRRFRGNRRGQEVRDGDLAFSSPSSKAARPRRRRAAEGHVRVQETGPAGSGAGTRASGAGRKPSARGGSPPPLAAARGGALVGGGLPAYAPAFGAPSGGPCRGRPCGGSRARGALRARRRR